MNIIQSILIIVCLVALIYYWNFMDKNERHINSQMGKFQAKKYESKDSTAHKE